MIVNARVPKTKMLSVGRYCYRQVTRYAGFGLSHLPFTVQALNAKLSKR
jgi:hypothetical protein